ncbi:MAG: FeoB-associated Cys-rich membrane protein [Clostridia bacterium]|nr:FeoB-associated Cys-rich membrane protein [Clostridia bacterium]
MLSFIASNLATIVVGAVVFGIVAAVVIKMVRDKKKNKFSCGCGCSGCPNAQNCGHDK